MAGGSSSKLSVDVTQFKQGMREAQQSAKTFQAQMKANEAQFKATGDKEQYLTEKGKLLKGELEAQQKAAKNAEDALKKMRESGVAETSAEYQRMAQQLAGIQTAMYDTQSAMNTLSVSESKASGGAKDLNTNLSSIAKNVSLDAVIRGIDSISGAMERAVKKAGELGRAIWDNISDAAARADDAQTAAAILGIDVETYQKYEKVFSTVGDITVADWQKAKQRVQQAIYNPSSQQIDVFEALGIKTYSYTHDGGKLVKLTKNYEDILWEVGRRLREEVESGRMDQGQADVYAQAIFGRSYANLNPLLNMGQEAFEQAVSQQEVLTEEEVDALAALNDELVKLKGDFQTLQDQILAGLAPALKDAATILDSLLTNLIDFLHSDDGKALLKQMGDAVSGLFEDLSKIDPQQVVQGFTDVFTKIVGGLEWLYEHKEDVIHALEAIVVGWGALKLTGGALDILKLINGIKGLGGGGNGIVNTVTGGGGDAATGGIVARIVAKVGGKEAIKAAAVAAAGPVIGTLGGMALLSGIAALAASNNYTYRAVGDSHRFSNVDNPKQLQTAVRGILSANDSNAEWKLGYLTAGIATPEELFGMFDYEDAEKGKQNYLLGIAGQNPQVAAAMYQMYTHRFGGLNTETFNGLPTEWRAALTAGQTAYGDIRASGGTLDYTALLSGMRTYFQDFGTFNAEGEWTIPVDPEVAEGAAEALQGQIDNMNLTAPVKLTLAGMGSDIGSIAAIMGGMFRGHANGIWSVPWDGYPAILHKGERVVPNRGDSYTSNVYFGSVNLNNGLEVEALTESIDRRNRRMRAGYGS